MKQLFYLLVLSTTISFTNIASAQQKPDLSAPPPQPAPLIPPKMLPPYPLGDKVVVDTIPKTPPAKTTISPYGTIQGPQGPQYAPGMTLTVPLGKK